MANIKSRKISVSLPETVIDDLDYLSHALGVSRSALLSGLLSSCLPATTEAVVFHGISVIEESVDMGDLKRRYRTSTKDVLDHLFAGFSTNLVRPEQGDLFYGK